jgi:2-methylcitrate dehydratase PrpD
VKAYPCCGLIHSTAHALESLKAEHELLDWNVETIRICTSRRAVEQNGDPDPREPMAAQYSLQYSAGVAIAKDARDPEAYAQHNLSDAGVRQIASRTRLEVDPKLDALYPAHFAARVVVTTKDGRNVERTVIDPHGTPADPCSFDEVAAKFSRLAETVKSPSSIERISAAARRLDRTGNLDELSRALREGNLPDTAAVRRRA